MLEINMKFLSSSIGSTVWYHQATHPLSLLLWSLSVYKALLVSNWQKNLPSSQWHAVSYLYRPNSVAKPPHHVSGVMPLTEVTNILVFTFHECQTFSKFCNRYFLFPSAKFLKHQWHMKKFCRHGLHVEEWLEVKTFKTT